MKYSSNTLIFVSTNFGNDSRSFSGYMLMNNVFTRPNIKLVSILHPFKSFYNSVLSLKVITALRHLANRNSTEDRICPVVKNNKGPSMLPCGTTEKIGSVGIQSLLLTLTHCFQFRSKSQL